MTRSELGVVAAFIRLAFTLTSVASWKIAEHVDDPTPRDLTFTISKMLGQGSSPNRGNLAFPTE